jgi:hypothetical protein
MLYFLTTARHDYTIRRYREEWGGEMQDRIGILSYEELPCRGRLEPGIYFFTDLERLNTRQLDLAAALADQIEQNGMKAVNHPRRCLLRKALLRRLFREGINRFDAYGLFPGLWRARLPAFLHSTGDHDGPLGELHQGRWSLCREAWRRRRRPGWGRMVVEEFFDIRDGGGFYHKYGAFSLCGAIVPRHYFAGANWCLKDTEVLGETQLDCYWRYLKGNAHEERLRGIFTLAGIDYGRMDYSVTEAGYHVWEINTNPEIISARDTFVPDEIPLAEHFNRRFQEHLMGVLAHAPRNGGLEYRLPGAFAAG